MYGRKRRAVKKPRRYGRRRIYRRKTGVTKGVKAYVKKAIHRNIENKEIVKYSANTACVVASTLTDPFNFNLLSNLNTGDGQGNRTGVEIKPMPSSQMKITFNLLPYNSETNPYGNIWVRVWVASYKIEHVNSAAMSGVFGQFFEEGSSTIGFNGNMLDMMLPVNKNEWTVYMDRKFQLGLSSGGLSFGGNNLAPTGTAPFSKTMTINFGKFVKAKLKYLDVGGNFPNNRNLWLIIQPVRADGGGNSVTPIEIHYAHRFTYEDA